MLSPEYLWSIADSVVNEYDELNKWAVKDMAERIMEAELYDYERLPGTARYRAWMLNQAGMHYEDMSKKVAEITKSSQSDIMKMFIKVENGIITDVKFKTFGCGAAIATSSISTEMIKGKSLEEALALKNSDVVKALDGLPPVKLHCSVLAEEAIHEAIADYYRKEGKMTEEEIKVKCGLKEHHCEHCM